MVGMVSRMNMTAWRIVPTLLATVVAVMLMYGAYESLTSTQVVHIASSPCGIVYVRNQSNREAEEGRNGIHHYHQRGEPE